MENIIRPPRDNTRAKSSAAQSRMGRRRIAARSENTDRYNERREALKIAAAALFKKNGLKATSLDEVAQLAGIDRASLYYYISSKKELFYEVVIEAIARFATKAESIKKAEGSSAERLESFLVAIMDHYATNYPYLYLYIQEDIYKIEAAATPHLKKLLDLGRKIDRIVTEIVKKGIEEGIFRSDVSPKIAAYGLLGMANWTHRWFRPDGTLTGREVGIEFSKMLLGGLLINPQSPTKKRASP